MFTLLRLLVPACAALLLLGCSSQGSSASASDTSASNDANATPAAQNDPNGPPKDGEEVAVITTNQGVIVFKFFPDKAPRTVENFKRLAGEKFYDGTKFHRVIPGFMIQGGDPNSKGSDRAKYGLGGPGYTVAAEFNDVHHERGIVSMARSQDPNSAGSQFFICVADAGFLDHQYTAFGKVVSGLDAVDKIVNLPRDDKDDPKPGNEAVMQTVRIQKWPIK